MALEQSPIYQEVQKIFGTGLKPVKFDWRCEIHVNGETLTAFKVLEIETHRSYLKNYTDEKMITVNVGGGDYDFVISPYRDKIEVTLYRYPLGSAQYTNEVDREIKAQRYRAVLMNKRSSVFENPSLLSGTREQGNRLNIKNVEFQLFDLNIEQLRTINYSTVFRNVKAIDVVKTVLAQSAKMVDVEMELAVKGVDVAPNYNETIRDHVIIPNHIAVTDLPWYIHKNCGGLYGAGFGYYLQDNLWYLYAPYDIKRVVNTSKVLTVINIPNNRLPNIEITYRETPNQLVIIANGQTVHNDVSETNIWNEGNAVRFVDASKVMESFGKTEDNRLNVDLKEIAVEYAAENRASGFNNVKSSATKMTSNLSMERSKIAYKNGTEVQFVWENAKEDLIYPGMPLKYLTEANGRIIEVYGCVIDAQYFSTAQGGSLISAEHICKAAITVFVNKNIEDNSPL